MMDPNSDLNVIRELEERVRARMSVVEGENERLRGVVRIQGLGLLLTLALLAVVAVAPDMLAVVGLRQDGSVLEARTFRLLDDDGIRRAELSVDDQGAARLSLLDLQSRARLTVSVLESGLPGLAFVNDQGQRRVVLGMLPDQTASLTFADPQGVPRTVVGLTADNAANLVFADGNGVVRMGLGLDGAGMGSVMLPPDAMNDAPSDGGGGN